MTRLRLDEGHVRRFAAATGDVNPLHLDPEFARRTPYGRCIVHGALVALAALGAVDACVLDRTQEFSLRFPRPVYAGEPVDIRVDAGAEQVVVEAWARGQCSARVTLVAAAMPGPPPVPDRPSSFRDTPRCLSMEDLETGSGRDAYAPDLPALRGLAAELGAAHVPDALLAWLATSSYTVGMLVPGRDAVFVAARVDACSDQKAGPASALDVRVGRPHPVTGLVEVRAEFGYGTASARLELQAFLRRPVPGPRRELLAAQLPPSEVLRGHRVLVVGASRGLGAAITAALATQGATVWAAYARSDAAVNDLRREFGADAVRPVRFDAAGGEATRVALATVGGIDGLVLCAAPPLPDLVLHRDSVPIVLGYVDQALAMTLHTLVEALPRMAERGWLAFVSSAALADPPLSWPHYLAAKGAVEALAAHCPRHTGLRVVTLRPPRMWTDMTNGPTGGVGAVAPEQVAAQLARWVMDPRRREELLESV